MQPVDLNIVLERINLAEADRFDLMVGTNIFIYYDAFEQSLALENAGAMLKPGGLLLTNDRLPEVPGGSMRQAGITVVPYDVPGAGTPLAVGWYRKRSPIAALWTPPAPRACSLKFSRASSGRCWPVWRILRLGPDFHNFLYLSTGRREGGERRIGGWAPTPPVCARRWGIPGHRAVQPAFQPRPGSASAFWPARASDLELAGAVAVAS